MRLLFNFVFKTKRRGLTVKAVIYAAVARFRIHFFPGSRIYRYLGQKDGETSSDMPSEEKLRDIAFVSDKVKRVAARVPWESKCLVQSMVAQRLLRDYGIISTLYLGVGRNKDDENKMVAHSWVRTGPYSVCGGNGQDYAVVAKFSM